MDREGAGEGKEEYKIMYFKHYPVTEIHYAESQSMEATLHGADSQAQLPPLCVIVLATTVASPLPG